MTVVLRCLSISITDLNPHFLPTSLGTVTSDGDTCSKVFFFTYNRKYGDAESVYFNASMSFKWPFFFLGESRLEKMCPSMILVTPIMTR